MCIYIHRRQEEITAEREEIDRQKKMLLKKRPSNSETGRKRNSSQASQGATILHNGTADATFLKPDAVPGMSWREYYESDEILKVNIFLSYRYLFSPYIKIFLHCGIIFILEV